MLSKWKEMTCNFVVTFNALEVRMPVKEDKECWLALVLKRGKTERFETPERIEHYPLFDGNDIE